MLNRAAVAVTGVGLAVLGVLLFSKKASAATKPPAGGGGEPPPSEDDKKGLDEAQKLASMLSCSSSNSPAVLRSCAANIRNYPWTHSEVKAEAYNWAANLDAKAQDIEDYQAAVLEQSMGQ